MKNTIFRGFIVILMLVPTIFVVLISTNEIEKYSPKNEIFFSQEAYGYGEKVRTTSIRETIEFEGIIDSTSFETIRIKADSSIYYFFEKNQEISVGEPLYLLKDQVVNSDVNGIVYDVVSDGVDVKVIIKTTDQLVFKTFSHYDQRLSIGETYDLTNNTSMKLLSISQVYNPLGKEMIFSVDSNDYQLNQQLDISVYTKKQLDNLIVVPQDCIYQSSTGKDVVRIVTTEGKVDREQEVKISMMGEGYAAVSNVSVDEWCDIEFGRFMNSQNGKNQ